MKRSIELCSLIESKKKSFDLIVVENRKKSFLNETKFPFERILKSENPLSGLKFIKCLSIATPVKRVEEEEAYQSNSPR